MRPANASQATGRLRLRHLMETTEAVGEVMDTERPRFRQLARKDSSPRVVSSFNLFQTPAPLAAQIAGLLADGRELGSTLEPSAGLGRLYRAIRDIDSDCPVTLVEQSPDCCRELYASTESAGNTRLIQADFLGCDETRIGTFDSVLMNPPFKNGTDIKHITHAMTLLNPGGRLVSICAAGPRQRRILAELGRFIELPQGSFKSEGSNVSAAVLIVDR